MYSKIVSLSVLSILLACGFSACGSGVETEGEASIYMMAAGGQLGPVREAIESGFDVNQPDADGRTLLHYAVAGNQPDFFEYLIVQYRANPKLQDATGKTAIDLARESGNQRIMEILDGEGLL